MKRDLDLCRRILLEVEGAPAAVLLTLPNGPSEPGMEDKLYNAGLLVDAGLLAGEANKDAKGRSVDVLIWSLTWSGHEFLDAIRDEKVWEKTQEKIKDVGGSVTLETLKAVASSVVLKLLGI